MSPGAVAFTIAGVLIAGGLVAGTLEDAQFLKAWYYVLPVSVILWVFAGGALAIPTVGLLRLARRSKAAYILLLLTIGAVVGGGIGAANTVLIRGIIVGSLAYAITASIVVWGKHES